jgi:hypothetical protein
MSLFERLKNGVTKATDYFVGLFRPQSATLDLPTEFTRYFLSDAIELRLKAAKTTPENAETVRANILSEYKDKVDAEIKQELLTPHLKPESRTLLEKYLADASLSNAIDDTVSQAGEVLLESLVMPWQFKPRWKKQFEIQLFLGLVMRAIQQVALNVIRTEYPLRLPPEPVPDEAQSAIRRILLRLEKVSRLFPSVQIKNAQTAETELRVLVARNSGFACLPLRPIPSSPLSRDDFSRPSAVQANESVLRLSRQIRHADGSILVTGYRGVGKSSFVNRVIYEALAAQDAFPDDEWLLVPVTVNLAKVSGVQNILRLTLRAVREALLEPDSSDPKPIPTRSAVTTNPLPLRLEEEIEPLHEAYIRATYKVTMATGTVAEKSREISSGFSIDPGKMFAPLIGVELGKFLAGGIKKTRVEKISRELNLLDYDENAAEDDLGRLIRHLAQPRSLSAKDNRQVRIKLVFVFDELDKMDVETGLKPMIEGLKNLFLQQHAVFILVTSKKFYYDLLKDRAIEDAMLNSYFSAIVNVPLLQFAQARELVRNWVFWESTDQLKTASPNELKLIEQLTRVLVYRSFGNPRDMIRELRLLQEWADTQQPYLTDEGRNSIGLQVFAALQDCVEKTAGHSSSTAKVPDAAAPLVSDRLIGDESRLEQVRRGLYILVEELINRQKLTITTPQTSTNGIATVPALQEGSTGTPVSQSPDPVNVQSQLQDSGAAAVSNPIQAPVAEPVAASASGTGPAPVTTGSIPNSNSSDTTFSEAIQELARLIRPKPTADLSVLEKIHRDNFSLVSLEDVQALAKRLGDFLDGLHRVLFPDKEQPEPLITFRNETLNVEQLFYDLTGRQALTPTGQVLSEPVRKIEAKDAIALAMHRVNLDTWPDKMSALVAIRELKPAEVPVELRNFLIDASKTAPSANDRLAAAQLIHTRFLFDDPKTDLTDLLSQQKDDQVLSVYMNRLREARDDHEKDRATSAILNLLTLEIEPPRLKRLTNDSGNTAFTVLPVVVPAKGADDSGRAKVTNQVLKWLSSVSAGDSVRRTALNALTTIAAKENVDLVDAILADEKVVNAFVSGRTLSEYFTLPASQETELKTFFRGLLRARPLLNAAKLLEATTVGLEQSEGLLVDLYSAAMDSRDPKLTSHIFEELQKPRAESSIAKLKLRDALGHMPDFSSRLLPLLRDRLQALPAAGEFTEEKRKDLGIELELATKLSETKVFKSTVVDQPFIDRFAWQRLAVEGAKTFPSFTPGILPSSFSIKRSSSWSTGRIVGFSLLALLALIPGFRFYQGDLPAGASLSMRFASRFILVLLDAAIVLPIGFVYNQAIEDFRKQISRRALATTVTETGWKSLVTKDSGSIYFIMFGVVYGLIRAHMHWIGPLTWRGQLVQFLWNLPALVLLAYTYLVSRADSQYDY